MSISRVRTQAVLAVVSAGNGSAGEIVERLHERRDRWGYSYYTIQQPVAREFAPVLARLTG